MRSFGFDLAPQSPPTALTIDECMIRSSGRSKFRASLSLKHAISGFKASIGKFYYLIEDYENKEHVVHMDRFYMTLLIASDLPDLGFGCLGVLLPNRLCLPAEIEKEIDKIPAHKARFYFYKAS